MPTRPDTLSLARGIKALVDTQIGGSLPLLGDAPNGYQTTHIGALKDYTDTWPCLEIEGTSDGSARHATNGKIRDETEFVLRSTVDYTNSEFAEENIFTLRDALIALLQSSARLGTTPGVVNSKVVPKMRFAYTPRNGQWWRVHECLLHVTFEYTIDIQP